MAAIMFSIIDEFGNRLAYGECTPNGVRKMRPFATRYRPVAFERLQNPDSGGRSASGTIAGAAAGGLVAGPVGAVIGALAFGNGRDVLFRIDTAEGEQFLCRCSVRQWPDVGRRIKKSIEKIDRRMATRGPGANFQNQSTLLWIGILILPVVFSWFTLSPRYSGKQRAVAFGWMAIYLALLMRRP